MAPRKRETSSNDSAELLRGIQDIRNEIKRIRREKPEEKRAMEEVVVELSDENEMRQRIESLEAKMEKLASSLAEVKDFLFQSTTGSRPFIYHEQIKEAMLASGSAERWKGKSPKDLAADLMTVQRALNEKKEFAAATELQGFVEIAEFGREVAIVNPTAGPWITKGLEDATGAVLCLGKERRGQTILWACLQRELLERFAEQERKSGNKSKKQSAGSGSGVNIPCQNCTKNGLYNVMHSISECAKRRNPCRLECRLCPPEPGTYAIPCHWRRDCPSIQRQEQESSSSRSSGWSR